MLSLGFQAERRNRSHAQMRRLDKELHKLILTTEIVYVSEMIVKTSDVFFLQSNREQMDMPVSIRSI